MIPASLFLLAQLATSPTAHEAVERKDLGDETSAKT